MHLAKKFLMPRIAGLLCVFWLGIQPALGAERGLLWKIEPAAAPASYLFGTIHTDDARVTDFSPELLQALQQSKRFMMETLPPRNISVFYMQQGTLRDWLKEEEIEHVLKQADEHAMRDELALKMKPWLLASVFTLPRAQSIFFQDIQLYAMAQQYHLELQGLEPADEHFSALDALSMDEQLTLLRAVLALSQPQKEQSFEAVVQAYVSGDVEQILTADEKWSGMLLPDALWDKVKSLLLDRRNARMAQRIVEQVATAPAFIAVGAAHLAGEGGIVARLRQAGLKVTPLQ